MVTRRDGGASSPCHPAWVSYAREAYLEFRAMHICMIAMRPPPLMGQNNCPIFRGVTGVGSRPTSLPRSTVLLPEPSDLSTSSRDARASKSDWSRSPPERLDPRPDERLLPARIGVSSARRVHSSHRRASRFSRPFSSPLRLASSFDRRAKWLAVHSPLPCRPGPPSSPPSDTGEGTTGGRPQRLPAWANTGLRNEEGKAEAFPTRCFGRWSVRTRSAVFLRRGRGRRSAGVRRSGLSRRGAARDHGRPCDPADDRRHGRRWAFPAPRARLPPWRGDCRHE